MDRIFYNIITSKLEATRDFYTEILDMNAVYLSDWFVNLQALESSRLEVGIYHPDAEVIPSSLQDTAASGILTIVVDNVDDIYDKARKSDIEIVERPRELFYGQRRLLLRDPAGTYVDVSSPCEPDPSWEQRLSMREDGTYVEQ